MTDKEYIDLEQKYNDLLEQYKELDNRVNRMIGEKYNLGIECIELKERLERTEEDLKYQCVNCMNIKSNHYRKALEEIKEIAGMCPEFDSSAKRIYNIINKVNEEE